MKSHWTQFQLDTKLQAMRNAPTHTRVSFAGAVLCNLEIRDIAFFHVNFTGTNFAGCKFVNVRFLGGCKFDCTCLVYCSFANVIGISTSTRGLILTAKAK